jgi:hypothetical protein
MIYLYEKAHPLQEITNGQGYNINNYPGMFLTVLLALGASLLVTLGIAAFAAALTTSPATDVPHELKSRPGL